MRSHGTFVCGALLLGLALVAFGARATTILDSVEAALQSAADDLAGDDSKDGKKRLKAANKGLKTLGKDTTSELADVKLLKKVAGSTLKRFADDTGVVQPIVDAADAIDASIDADLEAARARVPADATAKVTPKKVTKAIDRAQKLLDKSRAKDTKPRIAVLFKARKAADKAVALAAKLEPVEPDVELEATLHVLADDGTGTVRLLEVDVRTDSRAVVDTGTGDVQLADPEPVRTAARDAAAFQQGTKMVVADFSGESAAIASSAQDCDWEFSSWSPDGSVLVAAGTGPNTLAVFDRTGDTLHSFDERVYRGFPIEETLLWSRDGSLLAFRTDRNTNGVRELQVLDVATGDLTEVVGDDEGTDQLRYVAWASQSDRLVYSEDLDRASADTELVVVGADGTGRMVLSQPGQDVRDAGSTVNILETNPAGDSVLYEFRANGTGFLGTVNLDGTSPEVIATASGNFINVHAWSPDGQRIAYIDGRELFSCAPDGSDTVLVTATCPEFRWSPDGSLLLYRDGNGGTFLNDLFVADPDGANPLRISPDLVAGGNVEDVYGASVLDEGILIRFVADAEENQRFDLHTAVVRQGGPGKGELVSAGKVVDGQAGGLSGEVVRYELDPKTESDVEERLLLLAEREVSGRNLTLFDAVLLRLRDFKFSSSALELEFAGAAFDLNIRARDARR